MILSDNDEKEMIQQNTYSTISFYMKFKSRQNESVVLEVRRVDHLWERSTHWKEAWTGLLGDCKCSTSSFGSDCMFKTQKWIKNMRYAEYLFINFLEPHANISKAPSQHIQVSQHMSWAATVCPVCSVMSDSLQTHGQ